MGTMAYLFQPCFYYSLDNRIRMEHTTEIHGRQSLKKQIPEPQMFEVNYEKIAS